jgi:hypothetical protein
MGARIGDNALVDVGRESKRHFSFKFWMFPPAINAIFFAIVA